MRCKVQVPVLLAIEKKRPAYLRVIDLGAGVSGNVWKCLEIDFQTFPDIAGHI